MQATYLHASITAKVPASTLTQTSASFRAEIASEFHALATDPTCPNVAKAEIDVRYYWSDYLASGSTFACGGAAALWWRVPGTSQWKLFGHQGDPLCSELRALGIPYAIPVEADLICEAKDGSSQLYRP